MPSHRALLDQIDADRIKAAIAEAEKHTSGEIRVSVARFFLGGLDTAARRVFVRLGMDRTAGRNGVLILVVPSRRCIRVLGDQGIHERVGQAFWDSVAGTVSGHFKAGRFTEGLEAGVRSVGAALAAHFPAGSSDSNELPDELHLE
jgi:uncharacterized membrane protein